jgi:hypothetical protein
MFTPTGVNTLYILLRRMKGRTNGLHPRPRGQGSPLVETSSLGANSFCSKLFFFWGGGSATPCASPPPWPSIFSDYSFWVHHRVNQYDRQLLAHALPSDFLVARQYLSNRTIGFLLRIKLHALIRLGVSPPSSFY